MSLSNYMETTVLNAILRGITYTSPTTVYVALFTAAPTGAGGGTEVSGGAYARQAITYGAPTGGSPATSTNSALVQFPTATASWGTIVAAALFDSASGGNMLEYGTLATSKTVGSGDSFAFPIGSYSVSAS